MAETNNQNNSPNQLKFAGDVNVQEITITSLATGNSYNVANQVATIYIYEDLFKPFISGSIAMMDSLEYAANFPFVGEEVVDIKIYTPTMDKMSNKSGIIEGRFYIYKMTDRTEMLDRNIMYQLHFISIEAIADLNTKLSKGYKGKVAEIVKKLLVDDDELTTKKKVNIEDTLNKIRYISNFWSPVKNINYLLDHAQNASGSPTFTFFENRQGFNFVSLDSLNAGAVKQDFIQNDSTDQVDPAGGSKRNIDLDYKRITELNIDTTYDYMERVRSGAYGSQLLYMDLSTKKYYNKKFSMFKDWGKPQKENRLNEHPIASQKLYSTYRGAMFSDNVELGLFTDYEDVSNIQFRQNRVSRLKQAEAFKISIIVPGRTDYTVGQVVTVKKFKAQPTQMQDDPKEMVDDVISGKYLVCAINHVINRQNHECHMELIKDSLSMNLDKGAKTS